MNLLINLKGLNVRNTFKTNLFFFILAVSLTFAIYSCSNDTVTNTITQPDAGTISGTLTFVDTNKVQCSSCGYYDIAAYASWPPAGPPSADDTLKITKNGTVYTGTYKIKGLTGGQSYILAASYIRTPYGPGSVSLLAVHGCDTSHAMSCWFNNPKRDTIPSSQGLANINFLSWIDTTKRIYHF